MSNTNAIELNKANRREILGFSFNNASTNAVYVLIVTYFLVYSTQIYGFAAVVVGGLMTATRLFDAVTDPLIGVMIDRTNTKFGRFRPWILGGAIVSSSMIVVMFSGIKTGSHIGDLVLLILFYCIWVLGYTAQTACTKSAQTIVTSVPRQRSTINALGTVNTVIVAMLVVAGAMPMIRGMGGVAVKSAWRTVAMGIALIQLLYAILVVLSLRKKDVPAHFAHLASDHRPRFKEFIRIIGKNRALQMLVVAASTNKITRVMQQGLMVLFYFYVAGNQALQTTVTIATMPIMVVAQIAMIGVINRYGRKETFTFSSWCGLIFGLLAIWLVSMNPTSMVWLIVVLAFNMIITAGAMDVNVISMIGDAADYEYYTNGQFIPGMIGTSFSFLDKVVSSFSTLIIGAILTGIGFVSITKTPASPTLFWTVLAMFFGLPALGHFFSIVAMRFYPLDRSTHQKMLTDLAEREQKRGVADKAGVFT